MSREEIGKLDPWWVNNVLFYPRDSDGRYLPMPDEQAPPDDRPKNPKEAFHRKHFLKGFDDYTIDKLWEEEQKRGSGTKSRGPR